MKMTSPRPNGSLIGAGAPCAWMVLLFALFAGRASASICVNSTNDLAGRSLVFAVSSGPAPWHSSGQYEVFFAATNDTYSIAAGDGFPAAVGRWEIEPHGTQTFLRLSDFPFADGQHALVSCTLSCADDSPYETFAAGGSGIGGLERGHFTYGTGAPPIIEGAPSVTTPPATQAVQAGRAATFSVTAAGTEPLEYQWLKGGGELFRATNSTLILVNTKLSDAGSYSVRIRNGVGTVWSTAALLVVTSPPILEPVPDQAAFTGQDITLGVAVSGTPPFSFQWFFNAVAMTTATAQSQNLVLTNLTIANTGLYSVTVSNALGSVSSGDIALTVSPPPHPALNFGAYQSPAIPASLGAVSVPVYYAANGSETNLSFSIGFDPTVLTNATFHPSQIQTICSCQSNTSGTYFPIPPPVGPGRARPLPASLVENTQVFEDRSLVSTGRLGLRIVLPEGQVFAPDFSNHIGTLSFDLIPGAVNSYAGRVRFASLPTPPQFAPGIGEDNVPFLYPIVPIFTSGSPALNRQSGLVEQTLDVTNPGELAGNVRVLAYGLGEDSRTNKVRFENAIGTAIIGTNVVPVADLGAVGPGETRRFTLEYYVSDRQPSNVTPSLELRVVPAAVFRPAGTELAIDNYRFVNQVFLVEFLTREDYRYYIQYAETVTGTNAPIFKTALPPVKGTGSYVQWLDNGPPKTDPLPASGTRLYRLIETR